MHGVSVATPCVALFRMYLQIGMACVHSACKGVVLSKFCLLRSPADQPVYTCSDQKLQICRGMVQQQDEHVQDLNMRCNFAAVLCPV